MATQAEMKEAISDAIVKKLNDPRGVSATQIRNLAEAYAWLSSTAQPHGGHSDS